MASKITEEVAGDLPEHDKQRIDSAWERHKRAMEPNWPQSRKTSEFYLQRAICRMTCFVEPACQWLDGSIANDNQAHTRSMQEES